jgi:signal peptidase I
VTDEPTRPLPSSEATSQPGAGVTPDPESPEQPQSGLSQPAPEGSEPDPVRRPSLFGSLGSFVRELVLIVVVALIASALLRAFVVQAFFVPTGSMLPTIQLHDRILVSRIGGLHRGEVVVFEDPGGWIPPSEQSPPPDGVQKALQWVGLLPSSLHEHLVKRVIGLPGDHVVCCTKGELSINGTRVDESGIVAQSRGPADDSQYNVVVPAGHIFVLGDNRYESGDSSIHLAGNGQGAFVPEDLVTGRAMAVIWPSDDWHILHIPSAYDDVPAGRTPPDVGIVKKAL